MATEQGEARGADTEARNEPARTGFDVVQSRYEAAQELVRQESRSLEGAQAEYEKLERQVRSALESLRTAARARESATVEIQKAEAVRLQALGRVDAATRRLDAVRDRTGSTAIEGDVAEQALRRATQHLDEVELRATRSSETARTRLTALRATVEAARERHQQARRRLKQARRVLSDRQRSLREARAEFRTVREQQQEAFKALTAPADRSRAALRMFRADQRGVLPGAGDSVRPVPEPEVQPRINQPDGRHCPVCGGQGLLPGRYRHKRCEGAAQKEAAGRGPERQEPGGAGGDGGPTARYRKLVSAVERNETGARGERRPASARPVRLPQAREAVLLRCEGRCENPACAGQPDDVTDAGRPLLEVDHIHEIAHGGRDHPELMAALCPNCHAVKTRGRGREALRAVLAEVAGRRHRAWISAPADRRPGTAEADRAPGGGM
ncbi:HNH endonuclease [Kitasatospora sp. NPDC056327]|uniref:HNH endonuclease signature motif containing protein n=1 Tax=Kitasatospora sp. NPDC056327 TaxID=3345785 RepID=UPI0035DF5203